jgi:hypothetical protein
MYLQVGRLHLQSLPLQELQLLEIDGPRQQWRGLISC